MQQSVNQVPLQPANQLQQSGGVAKKEDTFFKSVGEYNITRLIGSGKFGDVRQAQDINTKEHLAVKIILRAKLKSKKDVDHINREITFMKMLRHPHVVALKEALQTPNNVYLFMELVEGGDLIDRLQKEGRLSERTGRKFFQQLIVAVRYCHAQRIAHRDLKLDNMLLDKNNNIKVADFGLANLAADGGGDLMTTVVGSPHYVAPEVLKHADAAAEKERSGSNSPAADNGQSGYDGFKADMWSLGVILYTMLSGHYPFENPNRKKLFEQIVKGEYRMSRSFTQPSANLIKGLLEVHPDKRLTINDVLADEWFKVNFDAKLLLLEQQQQGSNSSSQLGASASGAASPTTTSASGRSPQSSITNDALSPCQVPLRIPKPGQQVQAPYTATYDAGKPGDNNGAGSPVLATQKEATVSPALTPANHPLPPVTSEQTGPRPLKSFFFLGPVDACSSALCEVLRKMGCLFQNPEVVAKPGEPPISPSSEAAQTADRTLYGYYNAQQTGNTPQVFTIYMTTKSQNGQRVSAVAIEHRSGSDTEFQSFSGQVYAQLGAKVVQKI